MSDLSPSCSNSSSTESNAADQLAWAIDAYCGDCLARVTPFVSQHLSGRRAWRLNAHVFGFDLIRIPLNIAWAPFWLLLQLLGLLFRGLGFKRLAAALAALPAGMQTRVQKRLSALIEQQLLGVNEGQHDPLLVYMSSAAGVTESQWQAALEHNAVYWQSRRFSERMFGARTAIAELSSGLGMALLGALAFKKFTPGAIGGGAVLAGWWVSTQAVDNFWLGDTLGGVWYGWFPPDVSITERLLATGVLVVLLALVASLSGFITDPLQSLLGFHQRRLRRLIEKLRIELKQQLLGNAQTQEQYLARLADVVDWISLAASKA